MARIARIASVALITAGLVLLADAAATLAWKEPLSAVYGAIRQNQAEAQLESVRQDFLDRPEVQRIQSGVSDPANRARRLAGAFAGELENGKSIGTIKIPTIGADYVVVQGTDTADLQRGPGHYPDTALPGQGRTIAIAGHRTTYLAPFNRIDDIDEGDEIELDMPYGTFTYNVTDTKIVDPSDVGVVDDVGRERLVLSACHPLYSADQRYIVFADLEAIELPGPG